MCGIVGVAGNEQIIDSGWLKEGRDTLRHRGPDDAGEWWSDDMRVGLAHRRLSIIDLSPLGHQPMHLEEMGLSIVFNGEIYNFLELRNELKSFGHSFRSQSDTEVLLAAYAQWGRDFISKLNGMFAFALYDSINKKLLLARDRAGEKPLFYRLEDGIIYFASELKAIMINHDLPRKIDPESLDCYLAMGYVPMERCILKGYNKLPAAHALCFDIQSGRVNLWSYWQLPAFTSPTSITDEKALLEELEFLLEDAVGRQLISDVPVGILLSGGVDSSIVTAMAVRKSSKVRTFSIGFPGHGKLDETIHARLIARHFATEHIELMAEPTTAELLPVLARQFDEPMVDSSMFPTWLVSQLVRKHCTVALGGDGGDELFGGYGHYNRLLWMEKNLARVPFWGLKIGAWAAQNILPVGFKGRNYLQGLNVDMRNGLPLIASYFDVPERLRLLKNYTEYQAVAESIRSANIPIEKDLLQRATRMDFQTYLADDILVKVDRASMLNSLELRAPLLDYRIIEFAFKKVPSHLKSTEKDKKILLKKLAIKILPPEFEKQRKQGFSIPLSKWLSNGPFRELFWDTLSSSDCIFDSKTVRQLLNSQDRGYSNGERIFALVQFELWRKIYNATL
jgi:asparagine synthase (glutamine-hydrolysing)